MTNADEPTITPGSSPRKRDLPPAEAPVAAAEPEAPAEEYGELSEVFGRIVAAEKRARDKDSAEAALGDIKSAVGSLSPEAFRILTESEQFQQLADKVSRQSGTKPGDPIYDEKGREIGRVPLSYEDMCEMYEMVDWTPMETTVLSVNGVDLKIFEGMVHRTPNIFRDVAMESWNARRRIDSQRLQAIDGSSYRYADGTSVEVAGYRKETPEELIQKYGRER